jgi:Zn-dependent protease
MRWSFRLARVLGIDVRVHATFFLILLWVAVQYRGQGGRQMLDGLIFVLAIFFCVVLHEFGHALAARRYGIQTRDITLLPIGGVARLERMPERPLQELVVALAGPAVNVVIAAGLIVLLLVGGQWIPTTELNIVDSHFFQRLAVLNIFLVVFNMIPAFPMDGGRVLRALLALRFDRLRATRIAAGLGQALALVFGFVGLLGNPFLIFIAFFVWIGASAETSQLQLSHSLQGVPIDEVMLTEFHMLTPDETLARAAELTIAGSQKDFPVVHSDGRVCLLTQADLIEGLRSGRLATPILELGLQACATVDRRDMVATVLEVLGSTRQRTFPVVEGGRLVGLLTLENVGEFLAFKRAMAAARR